MRPGSVRRWDTKLSIVEVLIADMLLGRDDEAKSDRVDRRERVWTPIAGDA